jgi:hypothetical protein
VHGRDPRRLAGQSRLEVNTPGTPETLAVRVERDGQSVLDHDQKPKYEGTRPNGPDCEPVCEQSHVQLTLE